MCDIIAGLSDFNVNNVSDGLNKSQVDWDGYTIGYYGRIFEARNKTKGGSFEVYRLLFYALHLSFIDFKTLSLVPLMQGNDKDFFKFKIGSQEVSYGSL